jgi:hypothetical protein
MGPSPNASSLTSRPGRSSVDMVGVDLQASRLGNCSRWYSGDEAIKYKKVDVGKLQGDTTPLYQIPKNHCWWRYRQGTLDALSHRPIPLLSLKKRCEANFMWRGLGRAELGFSAFNL